MSSIGQDIREFHLSVRGHWSIESMHWHLDVTFGEDASQAMDRIASQNLSAVRKLALSIIKRVGVGKTVSLRRKRHILSMDFGNYIDQIMSL